MLRLSFALPLALLLVALTGCSESHRPVPTTDGGTGSDACTRPIPSPGCCYLDEGDGCSPSIACVDCAAPPPGCSYTTPAPGECSCGDLVCECDDVLCPDIACAAPPPGCHYEPIPGECCGCGNLVCECDDEPCPGIACEPPPPGCHYEPIPGECCGCGELVCSCEGVGCPPVSCPAPPPGCYYEPNGECCSCGDLVCECDEPPGARPEERACTDDVECTATVESYDCCGGGTIAGVRTDAAFTVSSRAEACAPEFVCDCVPQFTADDGSSSGTTAGVLARCVAGSCQSYR